MSVLRPAECCQDLVFPGVIFWDLESLGNARSLSRKDPGNYLIIGEPMSGKTHLMETLFPDATIYGFPRRLTTDHSIWEYVAKTDVLCYDDASFYWWKPKQWNTLCAWLSAQIWAYRPKRKKELVEISLPKVRVLASHCSLQKIPQDVLRRFRVIILARRVEPNGKEAA